jgi:hypothetical protein
MAAASVSALPPPVVLAPTPAQMATDVIKNFEKFFLGHNYDAAKELLKKSLQDPVLASALKIDPSLDCIFNTLIEKTDQGMRMAIQLDDMLQEVGLRTAYSTYCAAACLLDLGRLVPLRRMLVDLLTCSNGYPPDSINQLIAVCKVSGHVKMAALLTNLVTKYPSLTNPVEPEVNAVALQALAPNGSAAATAAPFQALAPNGSAAPVVALQALAPNGSAVAAVALGAPAAAVK